MSESESNWYATIATSGKVICFHDEGEPFDQSVKELGNYYPASAANFLGSSPKVKKILKAAYRQIAKEHKAQEKKNGKQKVRPAR